MAVPAYTTPFAQILRAIVVQTANALKISTDFVRPVASDDYVVTETEDLLAYIRPYTPQPTNPGDGSPLGDQGAGRFARVVGRRFRVYIHTRTGEDVVGGDEIALLGLNPNQTVGHVIQMPGQLTAEEVLLDALDDFMPVSLGTSNGLTVGPIHWIPSDGGPPVRSPKNDAGMVQSALDFQAVYNLAVNSTEPRLLIPRPVGS